LKAFAELVNAGNGHVNAKLTADIDMTGIEFPGIGRDNHEFYRFHATLDGQGHRIKNLTMTGDCVGLITVASDNVVIKNLIIDGASIYRQFIGKADRLCLTEVSDTPAEADTFFPNYSDWKEVWREDQEPDEKHQQAYAFVDYEREAER
jgi:dihydrofolate reductase